MTFLVDSVTYPPWSSRSNNSKYPLHARSRAGTRVRQVRPLTHNIQGGAPGSAMHSSAPWERVPGGVFAPQAPRLLHPGPGLARRFKYTFSCSPHNSLVLQMGRMWSPGWVRMCPRPHGWFQYTDGWRWHYLLQFHDEPENWSCVLLSQLLHTAIIKQ